MNRIRQINNKYQVLITPHKRFDSGIELMLGNWTDLHFGGFSIKTFNSLEDATILAFQMPDINWDQLVLFHKDIFNKLFNIIIYEINVNDIDVYIKPKLLNSHQIKHLMFERVLNKNDNFRLNYHMNDIISFNIIHNDQHLLNELSNILSVNQALRISFKTNSTNSITLVGITDLGTSYEIKLNYVSE